MVRYLSLLLFAALLLLPGTARAAPQQPVLIYSGQVIPLGYCQLTSIDTSTLLSACTGGIPTGATIADVMVEAQAVRYRDDSVAPTATVGMPLAVGGEKIFVLNNLAVLRFISQVAGAKLSIAFYR